MCFISPNFSPAVCVCFAYLVVVFVYEPAYIPLVTFLYVMLSLTNI